MKLTYKKILIISGIEIVIALLLIMIALYDYQSLWYNNVLPGFTRVRNRYRYEPMQIIDQKIKYAFFVNAHLSENQDGSFTLFSSKCEIVKRKDSWYLSLIKLDKNLKMVSEKLIPGFIDTFPMSVGFAGEKYYLINPDYQKKTQIPMIRIISKEGRLLSENPLQRTINAEFDSDALFILRYFSREHTGYIFYDDSQKHRQILTEVNLDTHTVIKDHILPSENSIIRATEPVTDPHDNAVYIAGTATGRQVCVWKLDSEGRFSRIINQTLPDSVSVALCMDDKAYLVTSTLKKTPDNETKLTVYAINTDQLDRQWSYKAAGNGQNRLCCLKTKDNWYISDVYYEIKNPHAKGFVKVAPYHRTRQKKGTEYYSAVKKFDNQGTYISQSRYPVETSPGNFQLLKTKDGRIIFAGITHETTPWGRPFVAVVK
jgi:hypothetical protein